MKCFFCKADLEEKLTNVKMDIDGGIIIIKNVPSLVCTQCGEVSYTTAVMRKLQVLTASLTARSEALLSQPEITLLNYELKKAA
jgi:YgiT-type zinc finger domain-containing protein